MQNITTKVANDKLIIEIDLKAPTTLSKSGKSQIVATTAGNKQIEGANLTLGLNAYRQV